MQFSVGVFDAVFGKKVTINLTDPEGKPVQRVVTEKWLDKMAEEGKATPVVPDNVLSVTEEEYRTHWTIDKDVSQETVRKFRDEATGELYASLFFREGTPQVVVMTRASWEELRSTLQSV